MGFLVRELTPELWPTLEDLFAERVDRLPVWSLSCFYLRKGYRKRGVVTALVKAALEAAERARAPAVEAYPLDTDFTSSPSFAGYAYALERAGFEVVARRTPSRPILRYEFERKR